jgi:hypothetical protein
MIIVKKQSKNPKIRIENKPEKSGKEKSPNVLQKNPLKPSRE